MIELPSKKFIRIFTAIAIVLILVFSASYFSEKRSNKTKLSKNNATEKEAFIANLLKEEDADNDGLKDWEEILWGTDPNNPDSDGDGTKDGEEVANDRNPLIAGPDDKIETTTLNMKRLGENATQINNSSQTEQFSKNFFAGIAVLKNAGNLNKESINNFSDTLIKHYSQTEEENIYTIDNILIVNDTTENIKKYGNDMKAIIRKLSNYDIGNEIAIMSEILSSKNNKDVKRLENNVDIYENIIKEHLAVSVPSSAVNIHLSLIKSYYSIMKSVEYMSQVFNDPLAGMMGVSLYNKRVDILGDSLSNLKLYLKNNNEL